MDGEGAELGLLTARRSPQRCEASDSDEFPAPAHPLARLRQPALLAAGLTLTVLVLTGKGSPSALVGGSSAAVASASFIKNGDHTQRIMLADVGSKHTNWPTTRPISGSAGAEDRGAGARGVVSPCLCLFDIDRTLTGKQAGKCPGNEVHEGVTDPAFGGGDLTLSQVGRSVQDTFCGKCHLGIVSAGSAGGEEMRRVLQEHLPGAGTVWSSPVEIASPLVLGCPDAQKAQCAQGIVEWFKKEALIDIPAQEVHFFDDHTGNTRGFGALGFNARQISCKSRQGEYGLCGASLDEIVPDRGIFNCPL